MAPIHLVVEHELHRATPGGTGGVKVIGNYAAVSWPRFDCYMFISMQGASRKGLNGCMVSNCSCLIFITIFCNCIILYTFSLCKNKVGGEVMTYDRLEWIF